MKCTCPFCGEEFSSRKKSCPCCGAKKQLQPAPFLEYGAKLLLAIALCTLFYAIFYAVPNFIFYLYQQIVNVFLPEALFSSVADRYQALYAILIDNAAPVYLFSHLLTLCILAILSFILGQRLDKRTKMQKMPLSAAAVIFLMGLAAQFVIGFGLTLLSSFFPAIAEICEATNQNYETLFGASPVLQLIYFVIAAPFLEEVLFRGMILTTLRGAMPAWPARLLAALVFGLAHGNAVQFAYATLSGLLLAVLFDRYQSLWASLSFHVAFNACSYAVALFDDTIQFFSIFLISVFALAFGILYISRPAKRKDTVIISSSDGPTSVMINERNLP